MPVQFLKFPTLLCPDNSWQIEEAMSAIFQLMYDYLGPSSVDSIVTIKFVDMCNWRKLRIQFFRDLKK
jgi:hypothetical protein